MQGDMPLLCSTGVLSLRILEVCNYFYCNILQKHNQNTSRSSRESSIQLQALAVNDSQKPICSRQWMCCWDWSEHWGRIPVPLFVDRELHFAHRHAARCQCVGPCCCFAFVAGCLSAGQLQQYRWAVRWQSLTPGELRIGSHNAAYLIPLWGRMKEMKKKSGGNHHLARYTLWLFNVAMEKQVF